MTIDPRTPVLVGGGQLNQRVDRGEPALEPVDLLVEAARRAAVDTGAPDGGAKVLAAIESVRVIALLSWRYADPGRLVAERLSLHPVHTVYTTMGGNSPQSLVTHTATQIAAGQLDVALIGGAEAWRTRMAFRAQDQKPEWTTEPEPAPGPSEVFGTEMGLAHPAEAARGVAMPVQTYPLFEQAVRAAAGRSIEEHQVVISELWSRFSAVAAANPNAWVQRAYSGEELRTTGPDNRMIGFPYPKLLNSNNAVEQGAAVLVCSVEAAERLGIPSDRWVFVHSGTDARDADYPSLRGDLHSSPAIRVAGARALELAGAGVDDLAAVDLYSCFPSAVQIAANELGLALGDPARPLTVTGGLSFAGGPWNNYVTHALATLLTVLRAAPPGSRALVTGNGGHLTKHAFGVYGNEPSAAGFRAENVQAEVDRATEAREAAEDYQGPATVESWTVMHDRDGQPETAIAAVLTPDGRRGWATSKDPSVAGALLEIDPIGGAATVGPDGDLHI